MKSISNSLSKVFLAALSIITIFSSCSKEEVFDPEVQFNLEKPIIKSYVEQNYPNMIYAGDNTGIWFEVIEEGDPNSYEYTIEDVTNIYGQTSKQVKIPTVTVRYKGKLLNNTEFDSNQTEEGMKGKISNYISSWYFAFVPKTIGEYNIGGLTNSGLKKGSKIRFVTPSYFAYGNISRGAIPANSPLFFEIEVLDIQDLTQIEN